MLAYTVFAHASIYNFDCSNTFTCEVSSNCTSSSAVLSDGFAWEWTTYGFASQDVGKNFCEITVDTSGYGAPEQAQLNEEVEVYVNGVLKRTLEYVGALQYGDYTEITNASIQFEVGVISAGDQIRFRVTSAYYQATMVSEGGGGGSVSPYASKIVRKEIAPGDWSSSGLLYYANVDISNIAAPYVNVECWNNSTDKVFTPIDIESISSDQIRIWMPINTMTVTVVVTG